MKTAFLLLCVLEEHLKYVSCIIHSTAETQRILESFKLSNYSKDITPPVENGPTELEMGIFLRNLRATKPRQINLELSFHFMWIDERLKYSTNKSSFITLPLLPGKYIWQPDIWIMDEQSGESSYSVPQMVEIRPKGIVELVRRLSLNFFCQMDYFYFPFDKQVCRLRFQSFAHTNEEAALFWWNNRTPHKNSWISNNGAFFSSVKASSGVSNQYVLEGHRLSKHVLKRSLGNFDHLIVTMKLRRAVVEYWFRYFIPLNLVIMLSMTSFWIDHKCIPARVTIPVIAMLTLQKIVVNLKSKLPYSDEVFFLEWFLNLELFFVFAVLLQFCMVSVSKINEITHEKQAAEDANHNITMVGTESYLNCEYKQKNQFKLSRNYYRNEIVHPIDKISRKLFPIVHILINASYFIINVTLPDYK